MKNFYSLVVHLQVNLVYLCWDKWISFISLCVGAVIILYSQNTLVQKNVDENKLLTKLRSENTPKKKLQVPTENEKNLLRFSQQLGAHGYAEQQIKTLYAIAESHNLQILKADYKYVFHQDGQFYSYQIVLPIKGSYLNIRFFAEDFLLNLPFASLDQISFKREIANLPLVEAKMQFSLFLKVQKKIEAEQ